MSWLHKVRDYIAPPERSGDLRDLQGASDGTNNAAGAAIGEGAMEKPAAGRHQRVIGIEGVDGSVSYVVVAGESNSHTQPVEGFARPLHHVSEDADGIWVYRPSK